MDKWLRNTNVVRIVALVIGILLWVVVHMEETNLSGNSPLREREETINNVAITTKYDETSLLHLVDGSCECTGYSEREGIIG